MSKNKKSSQNDEEEMGNDMVSEISARQKQNGSFSYFNQNTGRRTVSQARELPKLQQMNNSTFYIDQSHPINSTFNDTVRDKESVYQMTNNEIVSEGDLLKGLL